MNSKNINKAYLYIADFLFSLFIFAGDRVSKYFVFIRLKDHPNYPVFPNKLDLIYVENSGAAFGLLKDQKYFFLMLTGFLLIITLYIIIKTPAKRAYIILHLALILICAGSLSNSMDRLLYDAVIDFIHINYSILPVFNLSDLFVTLGTLTLIIIFLFKYKEDDLNFLRFKEKKLREI